MNKNELVKDDQYFITLAKDYFGNAVRDNSKQELISIGKAIEDGTIDTELL